MGHGCGGGSLSKLVLAGVDAGPACGTGGPGRRHRGAAYAEAADTPRNGMVVTERAAAGSAGGGVVRLVADMSNGAEGSASYGGTGNASGSLG